MSKRNQQLVFVVLLLSVNMFYVVASKNVSYDGESGPNSPTLISSMIDLNKTSIFIDDLGLKRILNMSHDNVTIYDRLKSEDSSSDKSKNTPSSHDLKEGKNKNQKIVDKQNNLFHSTIHPPFCIHSIKLKSIMRSECFFARFIG